MALIRRNLPSLINGVSQQPVASRLENQVEDQVNFTSSLVHGLVPRQPALHKHKLAATAPADAFFHAINRDPTERYTVVITDGDIKVYSLVDGAEKTVAKPDGVGYLDVTVAADEFEAVTVNDYTFIINKNVTIAMGAAATGEVLDGTVQTFDDLPTTPAGGLRYRIVGSGTTKFDDYYVVYDGTATVWLETRGPNLTNAFDSATMPHLLVRESDGTFTFREATWDERGVGDESTAVQPSFVGRKLTDVFFFRNRLGFLADENVILSRSSGFFNWWPESMVADIETDPIDFSASTTVVAKLNSATPAGKALILDTTGPQMVLTAPDVLSMASLAVDPITEYPTSGKCRPVRSGDTVYMAVDGGEYDRVREFYVNEQSLPTTAADITAHVPRYVPANIRQMVAAPDHNSLFAVTESDLTSLYLYRYYWKGGDEKVQSAWQRWVFGFEVRSAHRIGEQLYLITERADGLHVHTIELDEGTIDDALGFRCRLDDRVELTGVYDAGGNHTTWTLPYVVPTTDSVTAIAGGAFTNAGNPIVTTRPTTTTVRAAGDWSGGTVYLGQPFTAYVTFSEFLVRDKTDAPVFDGRLNLSYVLVRYSDTARFQGVVSSPGYEDSIHSFTGWTVGGTVIGAPGLKTGEEKVWLMGDAASTRFTIASVSHLPCSIQSLEWYGHFRPTATGI